MNSFLERLLMERAASLSDAEPEPAVQAVCLDGSFAGRARIAIYDSFLAPPQVVELLSSEREEFIDSLSSKIYHLSHERGSEAPFTAIKELVENLIHADFKEVVVTILNGGRTIRIADQGPGIADKKTVFEPGFSTATGEMKGIIKGVGSGLPIAKEIVSAASGSIKIEDNLGKGAVVTLTLGPSLKEGGAESDKKADPSRSLVLSNRQKKVLFLVAEIGPAGPSEVSSELQMSLSTAYRDLRSLEDLGLLWSDERGRRVLSGEGIDFMETFFN